MNYSRDDFKLSFDKDQARFFVNKEKGVVACTVNAHLKSPFDFDSCVDIPWKNITGVGVAKCHGDDKFDPERGKRIALAKAENKAYLNAIKFLEKYNEQLLFFMKRINAFCDKAYDHCLHNEDYIVSVSDKNHPRFKKRISKIKHGYTNGKPNF